MKIKILIKILLLFFIFCVLVFSTSCATISIEIAKSIEKNKKILERSEEYDFVDLSNAKASDEFVNIDSLVAAKANTNIANTNNNINNNLVDAATNNLNKNLADTTNSRANSNNVAPNTNAATNNINNLDSGSSEANIRNIKLAEVQEEFKITAKISSLNADYFPDSIIVNVVVSDNNGSFISGLAEPYLSKNKTSKDFWKFIIDSCKNSAQKIENLKVEEVRQISSPIYSICYVLDHSSSMGEERALMLQQSVRYSINKVKEQDLLSAIKFTNKSTTEVTPTADKEKFKNDFKLNGMASAKYGSGTNILLALDSAAEVLKNIPEDYKRVVVLFTDGESSMKNYKKIVSKLKNYKIKVFTICYGYVDFDIMHRLAKDTDGKMIIIQKISDFAKAFNYIYNTLTNYYKITYKPPFCEDLHTIQLNLNLSDIGFDSLQCESDYDKSVFNSFANVGTVTFLDIDFDYNKAAIKQESIPLLKDIAYQLNRNYDIKIKIAGHTDNIGSDDYNQRLSLARAEAVKKELIKLGIAADRLKTEGFGKTKPIAPNDTEENRKKNRRTEFIVIE